MAAARFRIEPLGRHDRGRFDCGSQPLNKYFRNQVGQDIRRRVAFCYVAAEADSDIVAGFYTLSASSVRLDLLPPELSKKLPRYASVPVVRVGRLAVDLAYRSQGLGGILLFDSIQRTCHSGIGAYAIVVDAKDDSAVAFYAHHGFLAFSSLPSTLFLPIGDALKRMVR